MKKRIVISVVLVVSLFVLVPPVRGDDFPAPERFEVISDCGEYVFRFEPTDDFLEPGFMALFHAETDEIIYTVEPFDFPGQPHLIYESMFRFSDDLRYFNFIPVSQTVGILFYDNGQLVNRHDIFDLVQNEEQVTFTVTMADWRSREPIQIDDQNNTLTLETIDGITYVFDLQTGEILDVEDDVNILFMITTSIGALAVVIGYVISVKKRGNIKNDKSGNS